MSDDTNNLNILDTAYVTDLSLTDTTITTDTTVATSNSIVVADTTVLTDTTVATDTTVTTDPVVAAPLPIAAPTVTTDHSDYQPGQTAQITAQNVTVGGTVEFSVGHVNAGADGIVGTADDVITHDISGTTQPWSVTDGGAGDLDGVANGVVVTSWNVNPDAAGQAFLLTATDETTGVAVTASFTDNPGDPNGNPNGDPNGNPNGNPNGDPNGNPNADPNVNPNAGPSPNANIMQWADGPAPDAATPADAWQNGDLNSANSHYIEGQSVPFRVVFDNLTAGDTYQVTLDFDSVRGAQHAYDYLTSYNATLPGTAETNPDPLLGTGLSGSSNDFAIPTDPSGPGTQLAGAFSMWGGTITGTGTVPYSNHTAGFDTDTSITLTFVAGADGKAVLAWGGHLATDADWGAGNGSGDIGGAPFHMAFVDTAKEFTGGGQESINSVGEAFTPNPNISITKTVVTADPSGLGDNPSDPADTGPLADHAGEVITYQIVVTNTGNVDLHPTVTDTGEAGTSLGSPIESISTDGVLEVGETWTYMPTYTVMQADINTNGGDGDGTIDNTASVTTTEGVSGSASASVAVDQDPAISIVKEVSVDGGTTWFDANTATGPTLLSGFASPMFEYLVKNTGNVDLAAPTVTDNTALTPVYSTGDNGNNVLNVGETWTYTATGTWAAGQNTNIGEATDSFNTASLDVTDPANYFGLKPHITLLKLTNGNDSDVSTLNLLQGQAITWTYDVLNDGNVALSALSVTDNPNQTITPILVGGFNSGDINHNGVLDTGETWHYQATGTAGSTAYTNLATATTAAVHDDAGDSVIPTATDASGYTGHAQAQAGLTKGYWATHLVLWDDVTGNEKGAGNEVNVTPKYDWNHNGSTSVTGDSGLLMGDLNHDGFVGGDGSDHLFFDLASAQALANSSVSGDARIILGSQAVAAQLNEYNDFVLYHNDTSPNGLINEAVQWLEGLGPLSNGHSKVNFNTANDLSSPAVQAIINDPAGNDYTLSGGALTFKSTALSSSDASWNMFHSIFDESANSYTAIDTHQYTVTADGEGLKNALAAYNHGLTGTTAGFVVSTDGTLIGWEDSLGGTPYDVHANSINAFWGILEDQNLLHPGTIAGVNHS